MATQCVAAYISGCVQGVGFRYAAQRQAVALGVAGYALNLDDGRVEVLAEGEESAVARLLQWLVDGGPRHARIEHVVTEPRPRQHFSAFTIRY